MAIKKITAIIDELQLDDVEKKLLAHGVSGFTVTPVRGRGKYSNNYSQDQMITHAHLEIYSNENCAKKIAELIMKTADVGATCEGLIAISPIDELFWVYQQTVVTEKDFNFYDHVNEAK